MWALGEMVPDHRVHLIIVLEEGLGHFGPGLYIGVRSKKMPNMLHFSSLPHSAAPKDVQCDGNLETTCSLTLVDIIRVQVSVANELRGLIEGGDQVGVRLNIANGRNCGSGCQREGVKGLERLCGIRPGDEAAAMGQGLACTLSIGNSGCCENSRDCSTNYEELLEGRHVAQLVQNLRCCMPEVSVEASLLGKGMNIIYEADLCVGRVLGDWRRCVLWSIVHHYYKLPETCSQSRYCGVFEGTCMYAIKLNITAIQH